MKLLGLLKILLDTVVFTMSIAVVVGLLYVLMWAFIYAFVTLFGWEMLGPRAVMGFVVLWAVLAGGAVHFGHRAFDD